MTVKICFSAFGTYPILNKELNDFKLGGAQVQQVLIGRELVKRGYVVTFIDFDYGQNDIEYIDGIQVIKSVSPYDNRGNVVTYLKNMRKLLRAFEAADADIVYQRSGITFFPLLFSKIYSKKYIYSLSHDKRAERGMVKSFLKLNFFDLIESIDAYFNIKFSDKIIAQSLLQKEMILKNFNKESILIRSAFSCDDEKNCENIKADKPLVIWVATLRDWKNPQLFLDIAKKVENIQFYLIGGPSENACIYNSIKEESEKIPNLEFLGFIPYNDIEKYFSKAWLFVNTSEKEGFPNTFLQSWAYCTPVISYKVNPDNIIETEGIGFISENVDEIAREIIFLTNNYEVIKKMGQKGRDYVHREHNLLRITDKYEDVIFKLSSC
jgi:glycosyltransferase involved in cell wall biosynthesis